MDSFKKDVVDRILKAPSFCLQAVFNSFYEYAPPFLPKLKDPHAEWLHVAAQKY